MVMQESYTTTVTQTPDGKWSWVILDPHQQPTVSGAGHHSEHAAQIAASSELTTQLVLAGELRSDGEPMTGIEAIDNDNSLPLDADLF
jgi:hypothetical protein